MCITCAHLCNSYCIFSGLLTYVSLEKKNKDYNNEKQKDRINKLLSELDNIEEEYWKITNNTAKESAVNIVSTLDKTCYSADGNEMAEQRVAVNDLSELKEFVVQCRNLCDELGIDPDIVRIS